MASAGEMTPPTGGRAASWERAGAASNIAVTMSKSARRDASIRTSLSCTTLKHVRFVPVMPGHSRSKNGVASLAYVPGIHVLFGTRPKTWKAGTSPAMTATKAPTSSALGEGQSDEIVLAMRPASEACGKRHDIGTKRLLSSDRG